MHLIYEALKKTGGKTDGDTMLAAMKGMKWESPRGPMSIDPETRDVEFATIEAVKDPVRGAKK
jgi:branched-chain amino acid transport system substrate-binding protein